jgi:hypothetical protein
MSVKTLFASEGGRAKVAIERLNIRQDKDGNRIAKLHMAMPLNVETVRHSTAEIKTAWEAIETRENKIVNIDLMPTIEGVNLEFFAFPNSDSCSLALQSMELSDLQVELDDKRGDDSCLLFSLTVKIDDNRPLRHWLVDNIFVSLWAQFVMAQLVLMPNEPEAPKAKSAKSCPFPECGLEVEHDGEHEAKKPRTVN